MANKLLSIINPFSAFTRTKHYLGPGGVRYPGGIWYYPRYPDEKDPEIVPSKLFRVERIKKIKGTPPQQRGILEEFGLGYYGKDVAIVKNIPEVNSRLWKIKHLVKITPITFPYGPPTLNDLDHTLLKEDGECIVMEEIGVPAERVQALEDQRRHPHRLKQDKVERDCRLRWLNPISGGY